MNSSIPSPQIFLAPKSPPEYKPITSIWVHYNYYNANVL